jgi:uncharacterized protein (DUF58 family)
VTAAELARKVRLIELRARRIVAGMISGAYHSAFKGQGVEFQEVREYVPGDDTRAIDWNVTARVGRPYLKRYAEERDQCVVILLDASRSQLFGEPSAVKKDVAAEIFAALAFAAAYNKDETALILFTDEVELYIPPSRGPRQVLRLIREVLAWQPRGKRTSLARALEFLCRVRRRRSLVFVISDFQDRGFEHQLRTAARFHEVVAFRIEDSREAALPDCGLMDFVDAESGERWILDTADPVVRRVWTERAESRDAELRGIFRSAGVDHLRVETGEDYLRRLVPFLLNRHATLNQHQHA